MQLTNCSRDLPFDNIKDLPNIFTSFRHKLEPLRSRPRRPLPAPSELPFPPTTSTPPQADPFSIPDTLDGTLTALFAPLNEDLSHGLPDVPRWPSNTQSAHPFNGGETQAQERVWHLLSNGAMTSYKDTRNGLLGTEFSTKLAGFLSLGCVSARWVHAEMLEFEGRSDSIQQQPSKGNNDFTTKQGAGVPVNPNPVVSSTNFSPSRSAAISTRNPNEAQYKSRYHRAPGYDGGENPGTAGVRFELLWRDYMRLCARKFGSKLHHISGFVGAEDRAWKLLSHSTPGLGDDPNITKNVLTRFLEGRTGTSLIDAAQRELFLTGYTSNRARQNVASFLAKKLGIDWRVGAEWYECMLVDYDCASNWGNWQYVAGVGNDPRQGREFNPIKQALDYDKHGEYIKAWVPELRALDTVAKAGMGQGSGGGDRGQDQDPEALMGLFQAWRIGEREKEKLGLKGLDWVERPLRRIEFEVRRSGGGRGRGRGRGRGGPRGGRGSNAYGGRWRSGDMDKMREFDQRM